MARILIITLVFSPDGVSTATLISELAQDLQARGHQISVITTLPHYNYEPEARASQILRPRWGGLYFRSEYHGIPVWHTAILRKGDGSGGRLLGYLVFNLLSLLIGLFAVGRQQVVLVVSPPLTSGIVGWLLGVVKRARFIYNVQELYPDTFIQLGVLRPDALVTRAMFWVEKLTYRRASALTVISPSFRRAIIAKGTDAAKIHIIPNFVDVEEIRPGAKRNPFSEEFGLVERFVILYAGNIGMTQSFDTLLAVAERLRDEPAVRFLIVGDGVRRDHVAEQITRLSLDNVLLLPYQPRSRVADLYASADVGLVPLMGGMAGTTVPSKLYSIMASGRPVLASVDLDSDIAQTVTAAGSGIVVPPDDTESLEAALRQALRQPELLRAYGEQGRRYVEAHFSRASVSDQYHALIDRILR